MQSSRRCTLALMLVAAGLFAAGRPSAYADPPASPANTADSLRIQVVENCAGTCLTIESMNGDTLALRSLRLEDDVNAKIVSIDPFPPTGAARVKVCASPIDAEKDASATFVIKDMAGETTRIPFVFFASKLEAAPATLAFGSVRSAARDTLEITLTNPTVRAEIVRRITLRTPVFRIIDAPALPLTLAAAGSMTLRVEASAPSSGPFAVDTMDVDFGCGRRRVALRVETGDPCVMVGDLDFGSMPSGVSRVLRLRISNTGGDTVTFANPSGGHVLEWSSSRFVIGPADLETLASARLANGEFIDVLVRFDALEPGVYGDTARLWAASRTCRDTSIWVARVYTPVSAPTELGSATSLEAIHPNPTDGATTIRFTLARPGRATIELFDERGARIATVLDAERSAGAHTVFLDATRLATGVYHVRLEAAGAMHSRSFIRR